MTAEVTGAEEHGSRIDPSGPPQPRISSAWASDAQFRRDLLIAVVAVAGISAHLILRFGLGITGPLQDIPLYVVLVLGGLPLVFLLIQKSLAREFGSDLLAGISIIAAAVMGQFLVGSIVVLMLSGGTVLEEFATRRASSLLEALSKRMPETAHLKTETGVIDIKAAKIDVGDVLVVFPHEICPVDGVVVEGQGRMNEAYLTGEPYETSKAIGAEVISGAINGESALSVRASSLRLIHDMRESCA